MAILRLGTLNVTLSRFSPEPEPGELVATHNFTSGWATFGQVVPSGAVPSGSAIKVGSLETQADIKTTWHDGSARFVVLTCKPSTTADQTLAVSPTEGGTFSPEIPTASVDLTISGTVWTAALPGSISEDLWLNGSLVREWRYVVTPIDPSFNMHDFLRVYFDVRVYNDGSASVDVTVENVLNIAQASFVTYDVDVIVNGSSVFSVDGVFHSYLTRWRKVFDVNLNRSTVVFDWTAHHTAGALPLYLDEINSGTYSISGPEYDILREGSLNWYMPSTGGRPEIGPYPTWAGEFLVHQTESQRENVLINGTLGGSWPIHCRENTELIVDIDTRPEFWLDQGQRGNDKPAGDRSEASNLNPDLAHIPTIAYLPYLMTGDRYLCDEMIFWGNYSLVGTSPDAWPAFARNGSDGLLRSEQVRGIGWGIRNLSDAAAYAPDGHYLKNHMIEKLGNNLAFFDSFVGSANTPLDVAWITIRSELDHNEIMRKKVALWEYTYLAYAIDHAHRHGFVGGLDYRNQIVEFQLRLFTDPEFPPNSQYPGAYLFAIGDPAGDGTITRDTTTWEITGGITLYTGFDQVYEHSFNPAAAEPAFTGYYGTSIRVMMMIAMDMGLSGAQEAKELTESYIASDLVNIGMWSFKEL